MVFGEGRKFPSSDHFSFTFSEHRMTTNYSSIGRLLTLVVLAGVLFGAGCTWFKKEAATSTNTPGGATSSRPGTATGTPGLPGAFVPPSGTTTTTPIKLQEDAMSRGATLRVALNTLLVEHVALVSDAGRSAVEGRPDFAAATQALDTNATQVAQVVGATYGQSAQGQFLEAWKKYTDGVIGYATATKSGDRATKTRATQQLDTAVQNLTQYFLKVQTRVGDGALQALLTDHAKFIRETIDAVGAKKYSDVYTKEMQAMTQAGKLADALTALMIRSTS